MKRPRTTGLLTTFFLTAVMLLADSFPARAIDFTATGTILTVTYTEPTQNTDGTPLDDLAKTNVYYQVGTAAEVKGPDVPASQPAGGGAISTQITVAIAAGQRATVTVRATATDSSGNESAKSAAITKTVDRLPPMPPS